MMVALREAFRDVLIQRKVRWVFVLCAWLVTGSQAAELRIVTEEFPPYDFMGSDGEVKGLATDVVREVMNDMRMAVPIEIYPWARAYKLAQQEPGTMLFSVVRTPEREPFFHWVGVVCEVRSYLFKLRTRKDISSDDLSSLKQYQIGVVRDWAGEIFLEKQGFKRLERVANSDLNIKKLVGGRVDMIEDYEANLVFRMQKLGITPNRVEKVRFNPEISGELYAVLNIDTPQALVDKVKTAFERVHEDGRYDAIRDAWLEPGLP